MKNRTKGLWSIFFALILVAGALMATGLSKVNAASAAITFSEAGGYEEGVYAKWAPVAGADGYKAYISADDGNSYKAIDNELIRQYADYWRVDEVALKAGNYKIKVEAISVDKSNNATVITSNVTGVITATKYDRSGFAFSSNSKYGTGSGAYNDDGTLRTGAQVIYVTAKTAKTCTATVNGNKVTGLQAILTAKQKKTATEILDIRIIGLVTKDDLDSVGSSSEGIQCKGAASYSEMGITFEGIGDDAAVKGFGFLIRNCGNVEFRNFGILAFMDDGISLDTDNCNIWIHDMNLYYGSTGGDADQAKGDGSLDIKGASTNITVSYNHFVDSGKCSLCGMSDSAEFLVTYHHNWFDHSDSRHPRIRVASVHVYNNYFDGNAKYGVGTTKGSSAFVEANYFRNCNDPMMSSGQGTDAMGDGTFSGENGGMIKAYANTVVGAHSLVYANSDAGTLPMNATSYDAYLASTRDEVVPASYVTVKGGTKYNNFDTSSSYDLGVDPANIDASEDVPAIVKSKAGCLNGGVIKWTFDDSQDTNYSVIAALKSAVVSYTSSVVSIGGVDGTVSGSTSTTASSTAGTTNPTTGTTSPTESTTGAAGDLSGQYAHNFTASGVTSSFYTIVGKLSTSKGEVSYGGSTLTQCLKMESSTRVTFTAPSAGKLTMVFAEAAPTYKLDDVGATATSNVVVVDIAAGTHVISKKNTANLFFLNYEPDGSTPTPVVKPLTSISLNKSTTSIVEDATETLTVTCNPTDTTDAKTVSWSSSDSTVATVDATGKVTAIKAGTATITATSTVNTSLKATCDVTVTAKQVTPPTPTPPTAEELVRSFVERMYTVVLGRDAEVDGLNFWTNALITGSYQGQAVTGSVVAKQFIEGAEFVAKNLSDEDFMTIMYKAIMDRDADETGMQTWLEVLGNGVSRTFVLNGFMGSPEFTTICETYGIEKGSIALEESRDKNYQVTCFAQRCYSKVLGRKADVEGLNTWCEAIITKQATPKQVAHGFIFSAEVEAMNLTNEEFSTVLYRTLMVREPESTSVLAGWADYISVHGKEDAFNLFADGAEFAAIVAGYGL